MKNPKHYSIIVISGVYTDRDENPANAYKIKISSLDTMSKRYLSGELDAQVK